MSAFDSIVERVRESARHRAMLDIEAASVALKCGDFSQWRTGLTDEQRDEFVKAREEEAVLRFESALVALSFPKPDRQDIVTKMLTAYGAAIGGKHVA